ncbi:transketolase family protein [Candidatus Micrarchaeota archaeon]|nr:transketolase family protein [Candidatus Micrarchaeota archaeon]MBU2476198.1 transketolase family protein [Candidatus Micrarchaeota archaeon]
MFLIENLKEAKGIPSRDGYGKALVELGKRNENVVALCCDLTDSTRVGWFKEKFPERFIEVGVAEQNMMSLAAGLSDMGKIPFVSSYAVFSPGRNWDQLRVSVCYSEANVKIQGAHAGISVGPDGATHQALEDIAITRCIPNLTVIVPVDAVEGEKATIQAGEIKGPMYLRFGREKVPTITTERTPFTIGKAEVFREGKDVCIIACGVMVYDALLAAEELEKEDIEVMVINNHTVKPLDKKTLIEAAKKTGAIVTAEEHQVFGGMGSAVAEVLSQNYPVPIKFVGIKDRFGESGQPEELLKKFGCTSKDIIKAVKDVLEMKK